MIVYGTSKTGRIYRNVQPEPTEVKPKAEPTKVCKTCGEVLPLSEFPKQKSYPDGRGIECKGCVRERQRVRYNERQREGYKRRKAGKCE